MIYLVGLLELKHLRWRVGEVLDLEIPLELVLQRRKSHYIISRAIQSCDGVPNR